MRVTHRLLAKRERDELGVKTPLTLVVRRPRGKSNNPIVVLRGDRPQIEGMCDALKRGLELGKIGCGSRHHIEHHALKLSATNRATPASIVGVGARDLPARSAWPVIMTFLQPKRPPGADRQGH